MHQVVPAICYLFWANVPSQHSTSKKRPWLDIENRPFSSLHQTTPCNPFDHGPTPLHWLDTGRWCVGHSIVVLLLHALSSSFPTQFLLLLFNFVLFHSLLKLMPFTRFNPLWGTTWACWACLILHFLEPVNFSTSYCLLLILAGLGWLIGPFSFPFFLWAHLRPVLFSLKEGYFTVASSSTQPMGQCVPLLTPHGYAFSSGIHSPIVPTIIS